MNQPTVTRSEWDEPPWQAISCGQELEDVGLAYQYRCAGEATAPCDRCRALVCIQCRFGGVCYTCRMNAIYGEREVTL